RGREAWCGGGLPGGGGKHPGLLRWIKRDRAGGVGPGTRKRGAGDPRRGAGPPPFPPRPATDRLGRLTMPSRRPGGTPPASCRNGPCREGAMPEPTPSERRTPDLVWLLALLALVGGMRAWQAHNTEVLSRDSVLFLRTAWRLGEQDTGTVLRQSAQHPAYSV